MANQLRDSKGRFLPKDAHIEDVRFEIKAAYDKQWWETYGVMPTVTVPPKPTVRLSKRRKRVILGYVGYVVLCFVMGAVGAYIGARI